MILGGLQGLRGGNVTQVERKRQERTSWFVLAVAAVPFVVLMVAIGSQTSWSRPLTTWPMTAPGTPGASIQVVPATGLSSGGTVTVSGTGFHSEAAVQGFQCGRAPVVASKDCDLDRPIGAGSTSDAGTFTGLTAKVTDLVRTGSDDVSCATTKGCGLYVATKAPDGTVRFASRELAFAPPLSGAQITLPTLPGTTSSTSSTTSTTSSTTSTSLPGTTTTSTSTTSTPPSTNPRVAAVQETRDLGKDGDDESGPTTTQPPSGRTSGLATTGFGVLALLAVGGGALSLGSGSLGFSKTAPRPSRRAPPSAQPRVLRSVPASRPVAAGLPVGAGRRPLIKRHLVSIALTVVILVLLGWRSSTRKHRRRR